MPRLTFEQQRKRARTDACLDITLLCDEGERHCRALESHATPFLRPHLRHLERRFRAIGEHSRAVTPSFEADEKREAA